MNHYFTALGQAQGWAGAVTDGTISSSSSSSSSASSDVLYSDGLAKGWQSWSYNGIFEPDNKTSPLPPGRTEVFSAL